MKTKKKSLKIVLFIFLIASFVLLYFSVDSLLKAIRPLNHRDEVVVINYQNNSNIESKVNLKKGSISFENPDQLDSYVLDYINDFDLMFNYGYSADRISDVKLNYKIQTELLAYYKESVDLSSNPKIWDKKSTIKEEEINFSSDTYNLSVPINLVLEDYLSVMNEFSKNVDIPIDGYIVVDLIVDISGNANGNNFNDTYTDYIKIPITKSVLKVNYTKKDNALKTTYVEGANTEDMKEIAKYIISTILVVVLIAVIVRLLFLQSKKSKYDLMLAKILRNYDDIIINTSTLIELDKYNVIEILEFKELLNLAREYSIPIFYYQYTEKKVSLFYILKNDSLYLYAIGE